MEALLTDLYQLTMLHAYFAERMEGSATFELFVRKLPRARGFLLAAGLEQALQFLETLRFTEEELHYLDQTRRFSRAFVESLSRMRFSGDVDALPEGTVFFENEPILRVTASISEAQLVETRLINLVHFQTIIATKAARSVLVAPGKLLVDFGVRRAHGAEAGLLSARASYLAGFDGTSNVLAGMRFGIPIYGTMAHSYVQAHANERDAFVRFSRANPDNSMLLIDTYDTEEGARRAVAVAQELAREGLRISGVRLDSGDLAMHAREVRRILDEGGLSQARIFASGGLDEHEIRSLLARGAPIDGFGIGTKMNTSADAPYLDCAYKLQEYDGVPTRKKSEGKETWPGRKQVRRLYDADGDMIGDTVGLEGEDIEGEPLLRPIMRGGRRIDRAESLEKIRERAVEQLGSLPPALRSLETSPAYPVRIADSLRALAAAVDRRR